MTFRRWNLDESTDRRVTRLLIAREEEQRLPVLLARVKVARIREAITLPPIGIKLGNLQKARF